MARYRIIAKIADKNREHETRHVKYKSNDLADTWKFLERKFGTVLFMNVFNYHTEAQLASFVNSRPPTQKTL